MVKEGKPSPDAELNNKLFACVEKISDIIAFYIADEDDKHVS